MHRAHVDDFAGGMRNRMVNALPLEGFNGLPGTQKLAGQVHVDYPLPLVQGHFIDGSVELDA